MASADTSNILGLLFGSFDPIHSGHLSVVRQAFSIAGCDKVLLIVQLSNSYKTSNPQATLDQRVLMAKLAVGDMPNVGIDKLSSTIMPEHSIRGTLSQLKQQDQNIELILLLGRDLAASMADWPDYDQIARLCTVFEAHRTDKDVSSGQIRDLISKGLPTDQFLPQLVADYIYNHNLY